MTCLAVDLCLGNPRPDDRIPLFEDGYGIRIGSPEGLYAAEHVTGEGAFETIENFGSILPRQEVGERFGHVPEGFMLPTDYIAGDNRLSYFSYGTDFRDDYSFGYAFDLRTLLDDYGGRASVEDLLHKYYDVLYDIMDDPQRMHAPPYLADRLEASEEMVARFLERVRPIQSQLRLAGTPALDMLRAADLTGLSAVDNTPEITVPRAVRTADAIGTFRYGEFSPGERYRLMSGRDPNLELNELAEELENAVDDIVEEGDPSPL